ncbi:LysR substrate-binding domain-containing protein [Paratractidigestivibacter sp.]|uniref:LysR substrate-binding domain-containing protein n=1 Tax=Paratractidigestivibacter sp. TaxID=2847316 RepID=UPI0039F548FF
MCSSTRASPWRPRARALPCRRSPERSTISNVRSASSGSRANRSISATSAGRAFYKKARVAVTAFLRLEAFPEEGDEAAAGLPCFRPPVFQGSDALTRSLAEFAHEKIGVDVDFSIVNPQTVRKDLGASVDALVTIGVLDRETIKRTPAGKLSTGIMISRDHPLAQSPMVSAADLADYPAAVSPWYDTFNTSILVMYRDAGIVSNIREATSLEESRELLANDRGYFFSAMYPRQHEEDDPSCCARSTPTESIGPEFEGFALPVFPPRRKTLIFRLINPCL